MVTSSENSAVTGAAVTLELAKQHLNIEADFTHDDVLIQSYIQAATEEAEGYCGRYLFRQRVYELDGFDVVSVECFAVASVVSVQYLSGETDYTDLPADNYQLDKTDNSTVCITFKGDLPALDYPGDAAVVVTLATACPDTVKSAILLRIGDLYMRREDRGTGTADTAWLSLMRPYRSKF
ncbi:head-tail connector protein [Flavobacterium sp. NRK1]|uniref:head-tail connector protein n=1 Tax=Flavobacterium sp. NRK1 TaxID=2954929 RepID=UPI002092180D|nr:head-tail connector protein [Flavobacterium sp. NRK1]MCO6149062.1 head-tail connector protein [Flavobacterium sp. NRK1]